MDILHLSQLTLHSTCIQQLKRKTRWGNISRHPHSGG